MTKKIGSPQPGRQANELPVKGFMMKINIRWILTLASCLLLVLAHSSCVKKNPGGAGLNGDGDTIDIFESGDGTSWGEEDLPSRPGENGMTLEEGEGQFKPVYFSYDSSQISASERYKLEDLSDYLSQNAEIGVIIEGHCDERGSREYNLSLGERRALAARAYLIGLGIEGSRIQTKSYGEENPDAFGHDDESWRINRRGDFILFY